MVLIQTSNVPAEHDTGLLTRYKDFLEGFIGPTQTMAFGNMLQVSDYERYNWTVFNPEEKKAHGENIFPKERQMAFSLGADMVG